MEKKFYKWESLAEFDAWHSVVKQALGLPRIGINQETGEPDPNATATTEYASVIEMQYKDFRAEIEDVVAEQFSQGLGQEVAMRPPYPSWQPTGEFRTYEAPIPKPNDGKEYYWDEETQSWLLVPEN